jgi:histidinol-phosphate aminotransferase
MSEKKSALNINPHIAAAPLYVAGTSIEDTREKYGLDDIIKLASNESPLGPSPKAVAAIQAALADLHRYPPAAANSLRDALADHFGRGLTADHFVTGNGGSEVIDLLTRGFVSEGDNIVICRPTFPLYEIFVKRAGGKTHYADLDANFQFDPDAILSAIDDRTRLVYLCSPNNPSGTLLPPGQAEKLVAEIPEHVVIVFDEAYSLFIEKEEDRLDSVGYMLEHPNVVSLRSLSKAHGLAGLRVGYAIAQPEIATYAQRLRNAFHMNDLAFRGAIAALNDDEYVQQVRQLVIDGRGWLFEQLEKLDLEVIPSHSNFIAAKAAYPSQILYERLLPRGMIVRPLGLFYLPEWFRVTVGTREENERFIEILESELRAMAEEGVSTEVEEGDGTVAV